MTTSLGNLSGVAFITGAASGMGRASAIAFARAGASLVLADINEAGLKETVALAGIAEDKVWTVVLNIKNQKDIEDTIRAIPKKFGRLDYAVNCAAIPGKPGLLFADNPQDDWDLVIELNLRAQVVLLREEINAMLQNTDPLPTGLASEGRVNHTKGAIVNFASRRGLHGTQVEVPYTATKHAMIGLSRSAAAGYASKGIRINTLAPGFIDTPMANSVHNDPELLNKFVQSQIPIQRKGSPEEIADLVTYLCSERATYIVGETICIDGGMHAL